MIEVLKQYIAAEASSEKKANLLRELLQLLFLKILHDKGYFAKIAFVGGTALRVLYDTRRFSEDLDFSLIDKKGYSFLAMISALERELGLNGLKISAKTKIAKTVQSGMLKFPGLLQQLGLSAVKEQNLSIKIELDSNPPSGWQLENTLINKTYVCNITHFALPSLYATKLHACFFRKYIKGRDFYDLIWYLGKKIKPNYKLLNNAIKQTHGESPELGENNIKDFLLKKLEKIDFCAVKKDVERFLEDENELKLLELSIISKSVRDVFSL
ncbi:MAG: nucleotidyl transferase AbiEii/AbiGii toxin family protein [Candidatus Omnitrophota bacterium]